MCTSIFDIERTLKDVVTMFVTNIRYLFFMVRYSICFTSTKVQKSAWKKHVKEQIEKSIVEELRLSCLKSSKGRTIVNDNFKMKPYLKEISVETASKIAKTRLDMTQIPCNYGDKQCKYCDQSNANTEHYYCNAQERSY